MLRGRPAPRLAPPSYTVCPTAKRQDPAEDALRPHMAQGVTQLLEPHQLPLHADPRSSTLSAAALRTVLLFTKRKPMTLETQPSCSKNELVARILYANVRRF